MARKAEGFDRKHRSLTEEEAANELIWSITLNLTFFTGGSVLRLPVGGLREHWNIL